MLHVIFFEPRIPGNSGAAIRLSANTGAMLHLIDPLFDMDDVKLRRAGLDYHDLALTRVHALWEECLEQVPGRIFAFTARTSHRYTEVGWQGDDALLFGPEPTGLSSVARSTSVRLPTPEREGTMKTSSYVRSKVGMRPLRNSTR